MSSISSDLEKILRAVAKSYFHDGQPLEIAILANSKPELECIRQDNWDGGTFEFVLNLLVKSPVYHQIGDRLDKIERDLEKRIFSLTRVYRNESILGVNISAELEDDPEWREKAKTWLTGKDINNQGRVRSDNIASLKCDGLFSDPILR
jgi:hypothetical protein